ncbi:MAG: TIGR04283 family arsenosugar biosynthesis glycosyltransferase [Thiohalocapsa sp.]
MPRLSIVIPTRRIDQVLTAWLHGLLGQIPDVEILVVEPEDRRPAQAEPPERNECATSEPVGMADSPWRLLYAPRGRGTQCNAGARAAVGELLLFLHDDTELPANAMACIDRAFDDLEVGAACFRLRFDTDHWLLRIYAAFSRFESVMTTFGDQGLVIRRRVFDELGGFPDWPLFEDVEIARRIRRRSRLVKLPATVTTSAVRFERNGLLRQQFLNATLMLRFLLGADPEDLRVRYERQRR